MKRQRLVIAGSGSTYTMGMMMSLIEEKERFPLKELVFMTLMQNVRNVQPKQRRFFSRNAILN